MDSMMMSIAPASACVAATANACAAVGCEIQSDLDFDAILGQMSAVPESEGASAPEAGASKSAAQSAAPEWSAERTEEDEPRRDEEAADPGPSVMQQITAMAAQDGWVAPTQPKSGASMRECASARSARPEGRSEAIRTMEFSHVSADRVVPVVAMPLPVERGRAAQSEGPGEPVVPGGPAESMGPVETARPAQDPMPPEEAEAPKQSRGDYTLPYERLEPTTQERAMQLSESKRIARPTDDRMPTGDAAKTDQRATEPKVESGRTRQSEEPEEPMKPQMEKTGAVVTAGAKRVYVPLPGERRALVSEDADTVLLRDVIATKPRTTEGRSQLQPAEGAMPGAKRPIAVERGAGKGGAVQLEGAWETADPATAARPMGDPAPADGAVVAADAKRVYVPLPGERMALVSEDANAVLLRDEIAVKLHVTEGRSQLRPAEEAMPGVKRPIAVERGAEKGGALQPEGTWETADPAPADVAVVTADVACEYVPPPGERRALATEDADTVLPRDVIAVERAAEKGRTVQLEGTRETADPTAPARPMDNPAPVDLRPNERAMPSAKPLVTKESALETNRAAQPAEEVEPAAVARSAEEPASADGAAVRTDVKVGARSDYSVSDEWSAPAFEDSGSVQVTENRRIKPDMVAWPKERAVVRPEGRVAVQLDETRMAEPEGSTAPSNAERTMPRTDRPIAKEPVVGTMRAAELPEQLESMVVAGLGEERMPADRAAVGAAARRDYTLPHKPLTWDSEDAGNAQAMDDEAGQSGPEARPKEPEMPGTKGHVPSRPAERTIPQKGLAMETRRIRRPEEPWEPAAPMRAGRPAEHVRPMHGPATEEHRAAQLEEGSRDAVQSASGVRTEPRGVGPITQSRPAPMRPALVESPTNLRDASNREQAGEEPARRDDAQRREPASAGSMRPIIPTEGPGVSHPVQAGESALTEQVGSSVIRQIAAHVSARAAQGGGEFRARLVPEHLGSVEIRIRVSGGACTAVIRADDVDVAEYIESHSADLKVSLKEHGIELAELAVSPRSRAQESWNAMTFGRGSTIESMQSESNSSGPNWNGANARQHYAAAAFAGSHFGHGGGGRRGALMESGLAMRGSHNDIRDSGNAGCGEPDALRWARGYSRIDYLA